MKTILLASALLIVLSCNKDVKQNKDSSYKDLSGEWITRADLNDGKYTLSYSLLNIQVHAISF